MVQKLHPSKPRVAAIVACHNRKNYTIQCLKTFFDEEGEFELYAFLFDDGSSDGTAEVVTASFERARVLVGDGTAFWNRGMSIAFDAAIAVGFDYYVWLNDDVLLERGFLGRLLAAHCCIEKPGTPAIVVGAVRSGDGKVIYGGQRIIKSSRTLTTYSLQPAEVPQSCDTFSGNCVLISADVVARVGNIDAHFFHNFGDFDYGLRAKSLGCHSWQIPGTVGYCEDNELKKLRVVQLQTGSLTVRWNAFFDRRLIDLRSRLRYFGRHLGIFGLLVALAPIRYLLPFGNLRVRPSD